MGEIKRTKHTRGTIRDIEKTLNGILVTLILPNLTLLIIGLKISGQTMFLAVIDEYRFNDRPIW